MQLTRLSKINKNFAVEEESVPLPPVEWVDEFSWPEVQKQVRELSRLPAFSGISNHLFESPQEFTEFV